MRNQTPPTPLFSRTEWCRTRRPSNTNGHAHKRRKKGLLSLANEPRRTAQRGRKHLGNTHSTPATTTEKTATPPPSQSTRSKWSLDFHACPVIARHAILRTAMVPTKALGEACSYPAGWSAGGGHMVKQEQGISFLPSQGAISLGGVCSREPDLSTAPSIMRPSEKLGLATHL